MADPVRRVGSSAAVHAYRCGFLLALQCVLKESRKEKKYYGVIFTCPASRYIYLEPPIVRGLDRPLVHPPPPT